LNRPFAQIADAEVGPEDPGYRHSTGEWMLRSMADVIPLTVAPGGAPHPPDCGDNPRTTFAGSTTAPARE